MTTNIKGKALTAVAATWPAFVFFADIDPKEARASIEAWISLPIVGAVVGQAVSLVTSRVFIIVVLLGVAGLVGWWLRGAIDQRDGDSTAKTLAREALSLAWDFDSSGYGLRQDTIADYNSICRKLTRAGLATPPGPEIERDNASMYFHNIGRALRDDGIGPAKMLAEQLVKDWPKKQQQPVFLGQGGTYS